MQLVIIHSNEVKNQLVGSKGDSPGGFFFFFFSAQTIHTGLVQTKLAVPFDYAPQQYIITDHRAEN